jgi:pyruvoyl-dependent arginine decarboxylase (PvlArgDC)
MTCVVLMIGIAHDLAEISRATLMDIIVSKGIVDGVTPIADFDAALIKAGVANNNLI